MNARDASALERIRLVARSDTSEADIAAMASLSLSDVRRLLRAASAANRPIPHKSSCRYTPTGMQILRCLTPEVKDWFTAQIPAGGTVEDLTAAIITDAYHDERK